MTEQETSPERRLAAIVATDVVGYSQSMQSHEATVSSLAKLLFTIVVVCISGTSLASQDVAGGKFYRLADGKVDDRTYNGFRRYHASCNHCHGSDGLGSTFGPSLVDRLPEIGLFRRIVRDKARRRELRLCEALPTIPTSRRISTISTLICRPVQTAFSAAAGHPGSANDPHALSRAGSPFVISAD